MSVPVHERSEAKLSFLIFAEKLENLTADIVMNEKYVPKKYRYVWVQKVFQLSMNIFENVRRGHILSSDATKMFNTRIKFFLLAGTDTEALLSQIAFARKRFSIPSGLFEQWEKMCLMTKKAIETKIKDDCKARKNEMN